MMKVRVLIASVVLGLSIAVLAAAQEKPKPEAPAAAEAPRNGEAKTDKPAPTAAGPGRGVRPSQLRAQVVLTRYQGDKKVSSSPYSFLVAVDVPLAQRARVKMGVEVPVTVAQLPAQEGAKSGPLTSFQYRNVGTNLDCSAQFLGDGLYQLRLSVENSSVYLGPEGRAPAAGESPVNPDRPLFRSFSVEMNPIMRDGETVQTVASTDPVTGEVVKIDLTVNVLK
jgi:hypothetical protein